MEFRDCFKFREVACTNQFLMNHLVDFQFFRAYFSKNSLLILKLKRAKENLSINLSALKNSIIQISRQFWLLLALLRTCFCFPLYQFQVHNQQLFLIFLSLMLVNLLNLIR